MITLPQTAEVFYAARDNRTNMYFGIAPQYTTAKTLVTVDDAYLSTLAGQVAFLVSVNLLSRWCRHVQVECADVARLDALGGGNLLAEAMAQARDADPYGTFGIGRGEHDLHLHIGSAPPASSAKHLTVISSSGWAAAVRRRTAGLVAGGDNPVGAAAAAVLGGAQLFRDALGKGDLYPADFIFDAFLSQPCTAPANHAAFHPTQLGNVLMVGAGSVGSATAYFMRLFALLADLTVTDADVVKVENFGRSPLFGVSNLNGPKVSAIETSLKGTSVTPHVHAAWWHDLPGMDLGRFDILLPVANEHDVRWRLQAGVPPLMVHASTGKNWNVNFGRHIPGLDDCLLDRFAGFDTPAQTACAAGAVATPAGDRVDAALPFLSFWAGFLMAADLVRLGIAGYPHTPNFGSYSFRTDRFTPQLQDHGPRNGCECVRQGAAFAALRGSGRYRSLSPATW